MFRRKLCASVVALGIGIALFAGATPAHAGTFEQTWGNTASYRASADFIPTTYWLNLEGLGGSGGPATLFYVQLVKTSDSSKLYSSPDRATNDQWWTFTNIHTDYANQAHYMRWKGKFWNTSCCGGYWSTGTAPYQGVGAWW